MEIRKKLSIAGVALYIFDKFQSQKCGCFLWHGEVPYQAQKVEKPEIANDREVIKTQKGNR